MLEFGLIVPPLFPILFLILLFIQKFKKKFQWCKNAHQQPWYVLNLVLKKKVVEYIIVQGIIPIVGEIEIHEFQIIYYSKDEWFLP